MEAQKVFEAFEEPGNTLFEALKNTHYHIQYEPHIKERLREFEKREIEFRKKELKSEMESQIEILVKEKKLLENKKEKYWETLDEEFLKHIDDKIKEIEGDIELEKEEFYDTIESDDWKTNVCINTQGFFWNDFNDFKDDDEQLADFIGLTKEEREVIGYRRFEDDQFVPKEKMVAVCGRCESPLDKWEIGQDNPELEKRRTINNNIVGICNICGENIETEDITDEKLKTLLVF